MKCTISKPKEPSIISKTKSAIFPMSIIELRSLLHSIKVSLLFFPLTTVTGPLISFKVCLVYRRTRLLSRVDLPTPGGPTTATSTGGGSSSGVRFTRGTCRRVWSLSTLRRPCLSALLPDFGANAYDIIVRVSYRYCLYYQTFSLNPCRFSLPLPFLSAFTPDWDGLCAL